jgi:hypothetical protein
MISESTFRFPTEREKGKLTSDPEVQEAYADLLMYLHDLLCERSSEPDHPVFDYSEVVEGLNTTRKRFAEADPALSLMIGENVASAMKLWHESEADDQGRFTDHAQVTSFLSGVLKAYQELLELPAERITKLAEILDRVLKGYEDTFREVGINIRKRIRTEGVVYGNDGDFEHLINNLVQNATKTMNRGATLEIYLSPSRERGRSGLEGIELVIADSVPSLKEGIFELFYTTKSRRGTGLGLATVAEIVKKHHGQIRVLSESRRKKVGQGVMIFLPGPPLSSGSPRPAGQ